MLIGLRIGNWQRLRHWWIDDWLRLIVELRMQLHNLRKLIRTWSVNLLRNWVR